MRLFFDILGNRFYSEMVSRIVWGYTLGVRIFLPRPCCYGGIGIHASLRN